MGLATADLVLSENPDNNTATWCQILWDGGTFKVKGAGRGDLVNRSAPFRFDTNTTLLFEADLVEGKLTITNETKGGEANKISCEVAL